MLETWCLLLVPCELDETISFSAALNPAPACCCSTWVMLNTQTRRPARIPDAMLGKLFTFSPRECRHVNPAGLGHRSSLERLCGRNCKTGHVFSLGPTAQPSCLGQLLCFSLAAGSLSPFRAAVPCSHVIVIPPGSVILKSTRVFIGARA